MARENADGTISFDDDNSTPEQIAAFAWEEAMAEATLRRTVAYKLLLACGYQEPGKGSNVLDRVASLAEEIDILDESGSILSSAEATLASHGRSDVYFLGLNPGGAADEQGAFEGFPTIFEGLALSRLGVSGWDQDWSREGATYRAGQAPMQRRFKHVAHRLGLAYGEICATNLVFARSRRLSDLGNLEQQIEHSLPIHKLMLDAVQPKRLWVMGNPDTAGSAFRLHSDVKWKSAGYANWSIGRGTVDFCGRTMQFCHTPHLSFWDATAPDKQELLEFAFGL